MVLNATVFPRPPLAHATSPRENATARRDVIVLLGGKLVIAMTRKRLKKNTNVHAVTDAHAQPRVRNASAANPWHTWETFSNQSFSLSPAIMFPKFFGKSIIIIINDNKTSETTFASQKINAIDRKMNTPPNSQSAGRRVLFPPLYTTTQIPIAEKFKTQEINGKELAGYNVDQINDLLASLELFSKSRKQQQEDRHFTLVLEGSQDKDDLSFFDSQELPCSQKDIDELFKEIEPNVIVTEKSPLKERTNPSQAIQQLQELIQYIRDLESDIKKKEGRIASLEKSKVWLRSRLHKLEREVSRPWSQCGR